MNRKILIYIYKDKAYFPVPVNLESGAWVHTEPVYAANLNSDDMLKAINNVISKGYQRIPVPSNEEMKEKSRILLKATKAQSWKKLCENGTSYAIDILEDRIVLSMSYTDEKSRWQYDPDKIIEF